MTLSLLDALHRALVGQHRHAEAAGVRITLAVPDCPGMLGPPPPALSRALPALVRAALAAVRPGEALEARVDVVTSDVLQLSMAGPLRPGGSPPPARQLRMEAIP